MDLTIQILTINNETTLEKTINSILPLNAKVQIIDLGSKDNTLDICRSLQIEPIICREMDRSLTRNKFLDKINTKWILYLNPWEAIIQGHDIIKSASEFSYRFRIFQDKILNKEVRLWRKDLKYQFSNPVFESLKKAEGQLVNVILYSSPTDDFNYKMDLIDEWIMREPLSPSPYYYKSSLMLSKQNYKEFLALAEKYLFLNPTLEMSAVMSRYYFAMVQVYHNKKSKIALQHLAICLAANPHMAEFWCLAGDVYYFLMKQFHKAEIFYENALFLGSKRKLDDNWPMDLTKYNDYPKKLLESCKKIRENLENLTIK